MTEIGTTDRLRARRAPEGSRFIWMLACLAGHAAAATPAVQRDLVFEQLSPLAHPERVLERMATPLASAAMRERLQADGAGSDDPWRALDLAEERFALFVPGGAPPERGFGLVVFVPPWEGQDLPAHWLPVLQRHGLAMVMAARSGNAQDVGARRVPLALHALENVRGRLRIDFGRVYAAGFSGGSRVALRLAVAWPDVFRGALLNAGSDPLGNAEVPLPMPALFDRLERTSRLIYASGTRDALALAADRASRRSATGLCIDGSEVFRISGGRHEPAGAQAFARALRALEAPPRRAADGEACRARRSRRIAREAHAIAVLVDAGDHARAARALSEFDARWSGLAHEAISELGARIGGSSAHAPAMD
jgi:poly(3-hydroxybutyrate) depolymerase